jgi:hypothetical protein
LARDHTAAAPDPAAFPAATLAARDIAGGGNAEGNGAAPGPIHNSAAAPLAARDLALPRRPLYRWAGL